MADKRSDGDRQEPTLELPKLFGRKKKTTPARPERRVDPASSPSRPSAEPSAEPSAARSTGPPGSAPEPVSKAPEVSTRSTTDDTVSMDSTPAEAVTAGSTTDATTEGARKAERSGPRFPPRLATVLTGLLVGALGILVTFGAIRGCEAVTGTGSCGEGPGLLLLAAIFVLMVLFGGLLLKVWGVSDPQSTSFLAVGVTAVVVMLVLLEAVFSVWMFLAVPLVSMAAYALAHWVTHRFVDMPEDGPSVDVQ